MSSPTLRPYQSKLIDDLRAAVVAGHRCVLAQLATGGGKTVVFADITRRCVALGGRVLVVAHRRELISQARAKLAAVGVTSVAVESVQTLLARGTRPEADLLIVDEAHHVSPEWSKIPLAYPTATILGFSATPARADGVGLGSIYSELVAGPSISTLTAAGHLVPLEIVSPASVLRSGEIAQSVSNAYAAHAAGRQAILFSPHKRAAADHAAELCAAGVRAAVVVDDMSPERRSTVVDDYRAGRIQVLVSVAIAVEGFDAPATSAVILARGVGSLPLFIQMVGRGLRPAPESGKRNCVLVDLRGVVHVHGRPDADMTYSLEGDGVRRMGAESVGALCIVCGAPCTASGCEDCGRSPSELKALRVTGAALVKFAAVRRDTPEQQAERLARWLVETRKKGWKDGRAMYRFKGAYGAFPSDSVKRLALELARTGRAV